MSDSNSRKRSRSVDQAGSGEDSSDDDFGPALPSSVPPKKKRKLPYESLYVNALPRGLRYSKSLMHKEQVSSVTIAPSPADFVITTSVDGVVKFWKKIATGIEFAKEYRAHEGRIVSSSVSVDGAFFATAGDDDDNTIKIFDVITFDLLSILNLETGSDLRLLGDRRGTTPILAATIGKSIHIYDGRGESQTPMHILSSLHRSPVVAMAYNPPSIVLCQQTLVGW